MTPINTLRLTDLGPISAINALKCLKTYIDYHAASLPGDYKQYGKSCLSFPQDGVQQEELVRLKELLDNVTDHEVEATATLVELWFNQSGISSQIKGEHNYLNAHTIRPHGGSRLRNDVC